LAVAPVFRREHHQRIALALDALDSELLSSHRCYFGGGTAIALMWGEFRESRDLDFLVSHSDSYRELRARIKKDGPRSLFRAGTRLGLPDYFLADQYGIRGWIEVLGRKIKFEIISEGRIDLDFPGQTNEAIPVEILTNTDLIAEKLLANSDRYLDTATFSRDLIDLAFMAIPHLRSTAGWEKALVGYGATVERDFDAAVAKFLDDLAWIDRCARALEIEAPRAVLVGLVSRLRSDEGSL